VAGQIKNLFDVEALNEITVVDCSNIKCRFLNLRYQTCTLKRIHINKNGACADFEEMTTEEREAYYKRLSGE